jgi:ribose transport system permease protein
MHHAMQRAAIGGHMDTTTPEKAQPAHLSDVLSQGKLQRGRMQSMNHSAEQAKPTRRRKIKFFDEAGLTCALALIILAIGIPNPAFFALSAIVSVLRQSAFVGIIAFGMVFLISMVEIDLSVAGIFGIAATTAAVLMKSHGMDPWNSILIALVVSVVLGAANGVIAVLIEVPLIIVSLGTLSVFLGLDLIISGAQSVVGLPAEHPFFRIFGGDWLGIPSAVWITALCGIVLHAIFIHSRFGATVRAIGSNRDAAEFIGIKVKRTRICVTAIVGLLCGVSGVLTLAFFKAVDPTVGAGMELQVIAAVVIGGTSLAGGSGTMLGALLGVLIISVINSGIVFFGVDSNYGQFLTGIVILVAIALDRVIKRRRAAAQGLQSHL